VVYGVCSANQGSAETDAQWAGWGWTCMTAFASRLWYSTTTTVMLIMSSVKLQDGKAVARVPA
jgi:hypothetical protein